MGLLQKAMAGTPSETVLIDGFPRNTENRTVWNSQVGRAPAYSGARGAHIQTPL